MDEEGKVVWKENVTRTGDVARGESWLGGG